MATQREPRPVGYAADDAGVLFSDETRVVSDDKRNQPPVALCMRQLPGAAREAPRRQPAPVFTQAGGDVWFEMSDVAWARDGSHYAFTTWEREKELQRVYLGHASEEAKPELMLERPGDVDHEVVKGLKPRFAPDGRTLVPVLDEAGWRQPHAIDVATKALRPLVRGEFEAHQIVGFTADSRMAPRTLHDRSDKAWAALPGRRARPRRRRQAGRHRKYEAFWLRHLAPRPVSPR